MSDSNSTFVTSDSGVSPEPSVSINVGAASELLPLPAGLPLGGYAGKTRRASTKNDCLTVRVLAIESAGSTMVIVSYDLLYVSASLSERLRASVSAEHHIPLDSILVCATHTHCAPRDITERTNASLISNLAEVGRRTVTSALRTMTAVRVIAATTHVPQIGANRRDRHAVADDSVPLVLFEALEHDTACGHVVATLINLACHPVVLDANTSTYHPDFVGSLRECVENAVGGVCLFLQGFAGDTNPIVLSHTSAEAQRVGAHAAGPIISALTGMLGTGKTATVFNLSEGRAVQVGTRDGTLHYGPLSCVSTHLTAEQRSRAQPDASATPSAREAENWISALFRDQDDVFNSMDMTASDTGPVSLEVQSMAIGPNLLLIGFPGEPFGEARQEMTAELTGRHVLTIGYANGAPGYLPSLGAYAKSGYEVGCSIVKPGTLERLTAKVVSQVV